MDEWTVERGAGRAYGVDYRKHLRWRIEQLHLMPTISSGHFANLKYEDDRVRVWLSRMTKEDGAPYNNQVSIEIRDPKGDWHQIEEYPAWRLPELPTFRPRKVFVLQRLHQVNREAWGIDNGWNWNIALLWTWLGACLLRWTLHYDRPRHALPLGEELSRRECADRWRFRSLSTLRLRHRTCRLRSAQSHERCKFDLTR